MEEYDSPYYIDCDGLTLPSVLSPEVAREAIKYNHKPGQIYLIAYPKNGSTWMQFIISLILRRGRPFKDENDFLQNTPVLEFAGTDSLELMDGPGVIKSHLPFNMIRSSPDAKYVYIARNPKDVCVSFYYHTKKFFFYNFENGTFDDYFDLFVNGKIEYGDYFDHVLSWYEHRNDPNVYFITYENMKKDTKGEVLKLAKFLGEKYYNDITTDPKYLENVLYFSSFEYMKGKANDIMDVLLERLSVPSEDAPTSSGVKYFYEFKSKYFSKKTPSDIKFVRKGIVGDWKNHFSPEQEKRMEEWIKRKTEGSDVMNLWKDVLV